ncbi:Fic family protein, partial [Clostridium baratii]
LMYRTSLYDMGLSGIFKRILYKIIGVNFITSELFEVEDRLNGLIDWFYSKESQTLEDILKFHLIFEKLHPSQDGNGRIGRFIYIYIYIYINLKQILYSRSELKYMNGETSDEYKTALMLSTGTDVQPLVKYINSKKILWLRRVTYISLL